MTNETFTLTHFIRKFFVFVFQRLQGGHPNETHHGQILK